MAIPITKALYATIDRSLGAYLLSQDYRRDEPREKSFDCLRCYIAKRANTETRVDIYCGKYWNKDGGKVSIVISLYDGDIAQLLESASPHFEIEGTASADLGLLKTGNALGRHFSPATSQDTFGEDLSSDFKGFAEPWIERLNSVRGYIDWYCETASFFWAAVLSVHVGERDRARRFLVKILLNRASDDSPVLDWAVREDFIRYDDLPTLKKASMQHVDTLRTVIADLLGVERDTVDSSLTPP